MLKDLLSRRRHARQEAVDEVAIFVRNDAKLAPSLHSLGNNPKVHSVSQSDDDIVTPLL
jgi:hypothetical protein